MWVTHVSIPESEKKLKKKKKKKKKKGKKKAIEEKVGKQETLLPCSLRVHSTYGAETLTYSNTRILSPSTQNFCRKVTRCPFTSCLTRAPWPHLSTLLGESSPCVRPSQARSGLLTWPVCVSNEFYKTSGTTSQIYNHPDQ